MLRDRVRSYFQAGRPVDPQRGDLVAQIADLDLVVTDTEMEALALENNFIKRHRPRFNVLLRDDKNHPVPEAHPGRGVPAAAHRAAGGGGRQRLRRALHPGQLGRRTAGARPQGLRHPLLQGDAERPAAAALPAVPDRALPGALRGRGLLARALPPGGCEDARLFLEGRTDEVVKRLKRADGGGGGGGPLRGGGQPARPDPHPGAAGDAAEDHHHRHRRARPVRRPRRVASARRCRSSRCATARWSAREGYLLDKRGGAGAPARLGASSSSTPTAATCRARSWCPRSIPDRELLEAWLTERARHAGAHPRAPARGEGAAAGAGGAQRAPRLRPRVDATRASSRRRSCAALRDLLDLEVEPRRIECFDISNIQGSDIVASMVVFEDGLPKKSDYRKFRIRGARAAARTTSPPCARWWAGATGGCWRRARSCPTSSSSTAARASSARPWRRSRSWASATSRWPAWPSARR